MKQNNFEVSLVSIERAATIHPSQTPFLNSLSNAQKIFSRFENGSPVQLFRKIYEVGGSRKTAGMLQQFTRENLLKAMLLRRDVELAFLSDQVPNVETEGRPAKTWGLLHNPGVHIRPEAPAVLTEIMFKQLIQGVFDEGGFPKIAMIGMGLAQTFRGFKGIAKDEYWVGRPEDYQSAMRKFEGTTDLYTSDVGHISLIPHPYCLRNELVLYDPAQLAHKYFLGGKPVEVPQHENSLRGMHEYMPALVRSPDAVVGVISNLTTGDQ